MVNNTQNYWVSGLCSSSGVLITRKHNVSETAKKELFLRNPTECLPLSPFFIYIFIALLQSTQDT
jgi:hypothetical protein